MKKLILVTSPPACGKTYISKELSKRLRHIVYLDKDSLIPLSKQIFLVRGRNTTAVRPSLKNISAIMNTKPSSAWRWKRSIMTTKVLINAPFTREIREKAYMEKLRETLLAKGAKLVVIWVNTSKEVCRQRMIARNSDRDTWKLAHWDEYIAGCNFEVPVELDTPESEDDLLIFNNSTDEEFEESMGRILAVLED